MRQRVSGGTSGVMMRAEQRYMYRLIALLIVVAPMSAAAQTPPPGGRLGNEPKMGTPTMPTPLTLPVEVVKVAPSAILQGVGYERAGLKPKEFRIGGSLQMTGATWAPFQEGPTTQKVVNGRTVFVGTIPGNGVLGSSCGTNRLWHKAFLQFRTSDLSGKTYVSNIKGDSVCATLPG
jgi:hypothetical protein